MTCAVVVTPLSDACSRSDSLLDLYRMTMRDPLPVALQGAGILSDTAELPTALSHHSCCWLGLAWQLYQQVQDM